MLKRRVHVLGAIAAIALGAILMAGCAGAPERANRSAQKPRQQQFVLKHVSPERAQALLSQLDLGAVFVLPSHDMVVVRGTAAELQTAAAVIDLVDAEAHYVIENLGSATEGRPVPGNADLGDLLEGVAIGTFAEPPEAGRRGRAIVDVHRDHFVAILPVPLRGRLLALAERGSEVSEPVRAEPVSQLSRRPRAGSSSRPTVTDPIAPTPVQPSARDLPRRPSPRGRPVMMPAVTGTAAAEKAKENAEAKIVTPKQQTPAVDHEDPIPATERNTYRPVALAGGDEVLQLDLPQQLDLVQLLDLVGEYLGLDYMYDPAKLKGQIVTLKLHGKLRGRMRVRDLYSLLESVLKFKGFAMTCHEGNLVTIVPASEVLQINPNLIGAGTDSLDAGDMVVTSVFDLQSIDTSAASTLLTNMKLSLEVTPVEGSQALIVTCYAHQIDRIEGLLRVVDRPGRPKEFRFRQLKYTTAKSLADKVKELAGKLKDVSVTISVGQGSSERADRPRPVGGSSHRETAQSGASASGGQDEVYLDADERTNRIMMIGYREQLALVEELVDALDVAQQDLRLLKVYDIRYVAAGEVMLKLQELEIVGTLGQGGGRASSVGKITTAEIVDGTVAEAARLVVLEATNSIAINATKEQHARIEAMLTYLDVQVRSETIPYEIYFLENQDPDDLAQVLEKIIHETVEDPEGKVQKVRRAADDRIMIVPDKQTFSLIVYANRKNQDWISKLIATLDRRRPQVLIDVTLVEVRKTEEFNYDLKLITSFPDLIQTGGQTGAFLDGDQSVVQKLLQPGARDRFVDFGVSNGSGTGFYADKHVNALLTAMQARNYGRILAKPKVLVNDNEKGMIKTTETTYVVKTSSIPVTSGTAGQQSNLIETAVDYEGYDAGITLEILPHISAGSLLRLEITLTRSDFGTITGERPPDQTSSDINTVVTVPDRSTIILGGMLKLNQSKGGSKVPLLGDLPLVGGAFRTISNSDIQNRLYVFVRAEVIRPSETHGGAHEELLRISEQNRAAFESHEAEFQNHEDWPGIKPKPTEPDRVLDAR